jgi:hypothetical protein
MTEDEKLVGREAQPFRPRKEIVIARVESTGRNSIGLTYESRGKQHVTRHVWWTCESSTSPIVLEVPR